MVTTMDYQGIFDTLEHFKVFEANVRLRKDILDLIQPYKNDPDCPPFTLGELIVFALVQHVYTASEAEILRWIVKNFEYYTRTAAESVENYLNSRDHRYSMDEASEPIPGFLGALTSTDLPIELIDYQRDMYLLSHHATRPYLSQKLYPNRQGHFPFLDLPPEIRNKIYGMLFNYDTAFTIEPSERAYLPTPDPAHRSYLTCMSSATSLHSHGRLAPARRGTHYTHYVRVGSLDVILALVRSCRQIYHESKAIFYSINHFYFSQEHIMVGAILGMGDNARYLRKVSLSFLGRDTEMDEGTNRGWKVLSGLSLDSLFLPKPCCFDLYPFFTISPKREHARLFSNMVPRLDRLVATAKRAKSVTIGYDERCAVFKDFMLQKIQEKPKVKMLCCSMVGDEAGEKWF